MTTTLGEMTAELGRRDRVQEVFRSRAAPLKRRAWRRPQVQTYADVLRRAKQPAPHDSVAPIRLAAGTPFAMRTFGAVFVAVAVDPELGLLRLRRLPGSYGVGRIINPRKPGGHLIGGLIWGRGMAAMEQSAFEPKFGRGWR